MLEVAPVSDLIANSSSAASVCLTGRSAERVVAVMTRTQSKEADLYRNKRLFPSHKGPNQAP